MKKEAAKETKKGQSEAGENQESQVLQKPELKVLEKEEVLLKG